MNKGYKKYRPFEKIALSARQWPDAVLKQAPVWCSVDLRDGNQALVTPMNPDEKLVFFKTLVNIGFKEIEVGFPSANQTEYDILRTLIDENHIPNDVTVQVLVQAREHLIRKTFDAVKGAKRIIFHFYNSTSALQRKVVFGKDMQGVIDLASESAHLIKKLAAETDCEIVYEYSPESFSGTEIGNALMICERVMEILEPTPKNPIILNLPNTVENATPNCYADQIEYFIKNLKNRKSAIISVHPHNDRGTGIAATELALLAGADRVEGTLFGNGERTGNVDIIALALNMFTQGIDPCLDFSQLNTIKSIYEKCTKMRIHERHPYAGELVFTAFSGSHQDAVSKGTEYAKKHQTEYWEIPYLPIDPSDVGREYEPIIRINNQSGKGGAAYIMQNFGYELPKHMHPEFGRLVKAYCDKKGDEISPDEVMNLFRQEYLEVESPFKLINHEVSDKAGGESRFSGVLEDNGFEASISGNGNGPIDAFFTALKNVGIENYEFISYNEHAVSSGADSMAAAYIELKTPDNKRIFGVGIDYNITIASIKGVLCAINRNLAKRIHNEQ